MKTGILQNSEMLKRFNTSSIFLVEHNEYSSLVPEPMVFSKMILNNNSLAFKEGVKYNNF